MKTETLSVVQTTKYAFKARKTKALQYFNCNDVKKDPVQKGVCICLRIRLLLNIEKNRKENDCLKK